MTEGRKEGGRYEGRIVPTTVFRDVDLIKYKLNL